MAESTNKPALDPGQQVFQIAGGYVLSSALYTVIEAGIAEHLSKGPRSTADLASMTKTNEDALYRILRLLASIGIFEEISDRVFASTPSADLLRKDHPRSLHDLAMFFCDPFHLQSYANLSHSLRTGEPAVEKTFGMPIFEILEQESGLFGNL